MPTLVTVFGAGGHAKVVIETLRQAGFEVGRVVDDDPHKRGDRICDVPIEAPESVGPGTRAVLAVGDNRRRRRVAERHPDVEWVTAVHPSANVHDTVRLGAGTVVFAGCVVQPDTRIGRHAILNTGCTVDHDCDVADFVHVAPGCHLAGNVKVGTGTLLGIGSCVIPSVSIGSWAIVGAGAVVVADLSDEVTAVGAPARPVSSEVP